MAHLGHLSSEYVQLLGAIHKVGGVACERMPDLFFPEDIPDPEMKATATKAAKKLCRACPVQEQCMTYALKTNQRYGIWGATEASER